MIWIDKTGKLQGDGWCLTCGKNCLCVDGVWEKCKCDILNETQRRWDEPEEADL